MAEPPRRRRGHAAASARVLTAGLSSAAAFGMVAGMALAGAKDKGTGTTPAVPTRINRRPITTALAPAPQEVIVVVRRHWGTAPIAVATASPAPVRPTTAPAAAQPVVPKPVARPITRTRSS